MIELVLEKLIFARSESYEELYFFIAFAYNQHRTEYKTFMTLIKLQFPFQEID